MKKWMIIGGIILIVAVAGVVAAMTLSTGSNDDDSEFTQVKYGPGDDNSGDNPLLGDDVADEMDEIVDEIYGLANNPTIVVDPYKVTIEIGDAYGEAEALAGVTANDPEDGDITSSVVVDLKNININKLGENQLVSYSVVDSDGNVAHASRRVNVEAKKGVNPVYGKDKDGNETITYVANPKDTDTGLGTMATFYWLCAEGKWDDARELTSYNRDEWREWTGYARGAFEDRKLVSIEFSDDIKKHDYWDGSGSYYDVDVKFKFDENSIEKLSGQRIEIGGDNEPWLMET